MSVYTFGQLKTALRGIIWPMGEANNLVPSHNKTFVDAMMDLQTWVPCLRQDHTDIIPQCSTLYNCGLTVFDAPRGHILRLSVIDKIDPQTHRENAESADDYCAEIVYRQIDPCYIRGFLTGSRSRGCCLSIPLFFGLPPTGCGHASYPVPTDAGLPSGLPVLPLGYHYPQTSTDRPRGRSRHGVWAIERGKIYIAPWLQTTETIILKWDGLKRTWSDADPVDPDPQLALAVEEYVRWQHAGKWDKEPAEEARALSAYSLVRQTLIRECREETRVRGCESSQARDSSVGLNTLYYNDADQQATATCGDGYTGSPVTVTIPAGTVGSNDSVDEANANAKQQAQVQANAQLVCTPIPTTYSNTPQTATASCQQESGAPAPVGNPVTVTCPAAKFSSTGPTASQADADSQAYQWALSQANSQLSCTYGNRAQTASCPNNPAVTFTVPENTYQLSGSQEAADAYALTIAQNTVNQDPACLAGGPNQTVFWNVECMCGYTMSCQRVAGGNAITVAVVVTVPANSFAAGSLTDAMTAANNAGYALAQTLASRRCSLGQYGAYSTTWPGP